MKKLLLILLLSQILYANYTEKEALFDALKHDGELKITHITGKKDSLSLAKTKNILLPQIGLEASQNVIPYDTTKATLLGVDVGSSNKSAITSLGVTSSQYIRGGGSVTGALALSHTEYLKSDSTLQSGTLSLGYTQPLLRGAWSSDEVQYLIKSAALTQKISKEQIKKRVVSTLTKVRKLYWRASLQKEVLELLTLQGEQSELVHKKELFRFSLGDSKPLDTLTSKFTLLQSRQILAEQKSNTALLLKELALSIGKENLSITQLSSKMEIGAPPEKKIILEYIKKNGSDFSIFTYLNQQLDLSLKRQKNTLLPQLDFSTTFSKSLMGKTLIDDAVTDNGNLTFGLRATYSFPIRGIRQEIASQRLEREENTLNKKTFERNLEYEVDQFISLWRQEQEQLNLLKESSTIAKLRLTLANQAFSEGAMSSFEVRTIENDWLQESIKYTQQLFALKQIEISLDALTETILDDFGVTLQ